MKTGEPSGMWLISQRAWLDARAHAAEADRLADARLVVGGVHRQAVAAGPVRRQVGLVPGERQHAAAVGGVAIGHLELSVTVKRPFGVGLPLRPIATLSLRPCARRCGRRAALREVGVQRPAHAVDARALARDPGDLAVLELRRLHAEPVAALADHAEHARRAPLGLRRDPQPLLAARLAVEDGRLGARRRSSSRTSRRLGREGRGQRPALGGDEVARAVAAAAAAAGRDPCARCRRTGWRRRRRPPRPARRRRARPGRAERRAGAGPAPRARARRASRGPGRGGGPRRARPARRTRAGARRGRWRAPPGSARLRRGRGVAPELPPAGGASVAPRRPRPRLLRLRASGSAGGTGTGASVGPRAVSPRRPAAARGQAGAVRPPRTPRRRRSTPGSRCPARAAPSAPRRGPRRAAAPSRRPAARSRRARRRATSDGSHS